MLLGRFFMIVRSWRWPEAWRQEAHSASAGSFPVAGPTFVVLLVGTVIIVGALTFVPALSMADRRAFPDARIRAAVLMGL